MGIEKVKKSVKLDIREALKSVLPQIFEDNKVNLNELKSLLSGELVEKEDDRFYFNWAGKNEIFKLIQAPTYGTLKTDKKKSIDFKKTENLMIVGENLEILKLLLKPYFNKVKMIYIDPPYNKDGDRIYLDNFKQPLKEYLEKTGQIDSEGNKFISNTEDRGRYHSDWLNLIYPRLFIARSILKDEGLIFVSIDDNELHHLRMVMDEIFGEENFIGVIKRRAARKTAHLSKTMSDICDYVVIYSKTRIKEPLSVESVADTTRPVFNEGNTIATRVISKGTIAKCDDGLYKKGKYSARSIEFELMSDLRIGNGKSKNVVEIKGPFRINQDILSKTVYITRNFSLRRSLLDNEKDIAKAMSDLLDKPSFYNEMGSEEIKRIFGKNVFDNSKPFQFIEYLINSASSPEENEDNFIVLDFFAGSGTTGQAVWNLGKSNGLKPTFILVQADELVDESTDTGKNALKLGLKTIADICIERLNKVSEECKKDKTLFGKQDFGFKLLRLDKSNFNLKDEFDISNEKDAKELKKKYLDWLGIWIKEPLVAGWKPLDVAYEVMLKEGFDLNSLIEDVKIKSNDFLYVVDKKGEQEFYISLDDKINKATIEEIRTTKYKNKTFVFLDKALTDNDKLNLKAFVRIKVI